MPRSQSMFGINIPPHNTPGSCQLPAHNVATRSATLNEPGLGRRLRMITQAKKRVQGQCS